jgi:hypothetical protein
MSGAGGTVDPREQPTDDYSGQNTGTTSTATSP